MEKRILNIGCGGEEYGTHFIDAYPSRKNVIKCNVEHEKIPFKDNFFDEVYCKGLFEHLKNPNEYLKKVFRVLKPGGNAVIITDNAFYWVWMLNNSLHLGGYERPQYPDDCHYALYTETHLKNHLSKSGFSDIKTELQFQPVYSSFIRKILCKIVNSFWLATPFKRMAYMHIKVIGTKK